ncbi:MAG: SAM-dependent methyltransferase [Polaromonas sp. 39-63-203]|jgi:ubiquinone/menaquinone biosynthesis C-methylase UbiE|uniref:class I SAM-dependent methyltransferase n=1 Tax=Polaromonas sp. TaxID=1869339 RepID=UPI000BD80CD8|nr:class I SAM-dependent methyltransferase [Polaromonas sp.]OZA98731.1 MAG: SAM-dependent methyltransferase [Polaromonas sp. 39-63-203]HQS32172.1 methyltransferase domain-containing protein [Polaromonas sp.]HQS92209.1 methyltransferase domain-containing protein [Polaromonas sp.]
METTMQPTTTSPVTDFSAVKLKQQAAWSAGDYAVVGTTLQIVGEELCEALDLAAGARVLDVAAGNGNATLAAARRWCDVVSTDYVGALLERGKARASAEGLAVQFEEADAENLPYADASFDVVLSTFGVMFTPNQERAASELARVCKPGGQIGLANWTPSGFIGELFKVIGRYLPPPAGVKPPSLWGTEAHLRELFGKHTGTMKVQRKNFVFRYRTPQHWLDTFRTYYGPMHKAFGALDTSRQASLAADLIGLVQQFNEAPGGAMRLPSEYLEVVIKRR